MFSKQPRKKLPDNLNIIALSDLHGDPLKIAKLYTVIKEKIERDKDQNPHVKHALLVPGDIFSVNGVLSTVSKGEFDIEGIVAIAKLFPEGYRFFTPGNHDYVNDEQQLINLIKKANFRVVVSNTQFKANSQLVFEKVAELVVDGQTVKIGGLMTPETLNSPPAKKVIEDAKSFDPRPAILEENPPDIVMSHLGSGSDKQLSYPLVVGGHTHDRQVERIGDRLVVNTGAGECIVVIRKGGEVAEIIESTHCAPSPEIMEIISRYERQYKIDVTALSRPVFKIAAHSSTPSGLELAEEESPRCQTLMPVFHLE